jgi:hypothetical protein
MVFSPLLSRKKAAPGTNATLASSTALPEPGAGHARRQGQPDEEAAFRPGPADAAPCNCRFNQRLGPALMPA